MSEAPPSVESLLHAHLHEVFGERDADRRRATIARIYHDDVRFADPEGVEVGHDAVHAKVDAILDGAPSSFVFAAAGAAHVVQDLGHLAWTFGPEKGPPAVRGFDVLLVREGRIARAYTVLTG
jgi:hypothetical protein